MSSNQEKVNEAKLKVTQIGSSIGRKYDQEETLVGLGLNKMHKSVILQDTNSVRGMIKKVQHLLKVENIN
ncbi:50S ribosomal protein L30 [Candidatus Tisiphia endosymbiont of Empis tessellata]|uniref:Large ribosomal subunit protein uL30 n=1 Tax=Candidatus Tisiphia endosymbiont of Sergentomyia squamirostris TaxID=3113639 RepID=A0AAT9G6U4_9RICK